MFWTMKMFGTDVYHLVGAFVIYSMLGWLVESIYMSLCNRKLTNRGFGKGPFCPIYGFGAVIGYLVLTPLKDNHLLLYISGAVLATAFEFAVGKLMIHFLGELWWDYHEKPLNYKGIICLESTIAWGVYAVGVVCFLHKKVMEALDIVEPSIGIGIITFILCVVLIDYIFQFMKIFKVDLGRPREYVVKRYESFKGRWN